MEKSEGWSFAYMGTDHDVEGVTVSLSITNVVKFEKTEEETLRSFKKERVSSGLLKSCEENFFKLFWILPGGGAIFAENFKRSMKKFIFALSCAAMMLVCGCSKESHGDQNHVTCPVESDWSGLVKAHPLFVGFPEFTGRIQNPLYSDLGDGEETIVFIVYNCKEDVATDYCKRLASFGFTKDDSWKYTKVADGITYIFTGTYSSGNFGLNFYVKSASK